MNNKSGSFSKKIVSYIKSGKLLPALCNIIGTLILILVILTALPLSIPRFMGYEIYEIVTGSMEPAIPVGSVVYSKYVSPGSIAEGDIIVFRSEEAIVTHRVVVNRQVEGTFVTKGDANANQDPLPVPYSDVIGKVEHHFPAVGRFFSIYSSPAGKIYVFMVAASGVMFNLMGSRLKYALQRKKEEEENAEAGSGTAAAESSADGTEKKEFIAEKAETENAGVTDDNQKVLFRASGDTAPVSNTEKNIEETVQDTKSVDSGDADVSDVEGWKVAPPITAGNSNSARRRRRAGRARVRDIEDGTAADEVAPGNEITSKNDRKRQKPEKKRRAEILPEPEDEEEYVKVRKYLFYWQEKRAEEKEREKEKEKDTRSVFHRDQDEPVKHDVKEVPEAEPAEAQVVTEQPAEKTGSEKEVHPAAEVNVNKDADIKDSGLPEEKAVNASEASDKADVTGDISVVSVPEEKITESAGKAGESVTETAEVSAEEVLPEYTGKTAPDITGPAEEKAETYAAKREERPEPAETAAAAEVRTEPEKIGPEPQKNGNEAESNGHNAEEPEKAASVPDIADWFSFLSDIEGHSSKTRSDIDVEDFGFFGADSGGKKD